MALGVEVSNRFHSAPPLKTGPINRSSSHELNRPEAEQPLMSATIGHH